MCTARTDCPPRLLKFWGAQRTLRTVCRVGDHVWIDVPRPTPITRDQRLSPLCDSCSCLSTRARFYTPPPAPYAHGPRPLMLLEPTSARRRSVTGVTHSNV